MSFNISLNTPEMTIEQYAKHTGFSVKTIKSMIDRGQLPTVKIGRRRCINILARCAECAKATHHE